MILVSSEIADVRKRLQRTAMEGATLTVLEQREIAHRLMLLEDLARNQEEELRFWALLDVQREGRKCVEQFATEAAGNMMLGTDKIIRPNFGRDGK